MKTTQSLDRLTAEIPRQAQGQIKEPNDHPERAESIWNYTPQAPLLGDTAELFTVQSESPLTETLSQLETDHG